MIPDFSLLYTLIHNTEKVYIIVKGELRPIEHHSNVKSGMVVHARRSPTKKNCNIATSYCSLIWASLTLAERMVQSLRSQKSTWKYGLMYELYAFTKVYVCKQGDNL